MQYKEVVYVNKRSEIFYFQNGKLKFQHDRDFQILSEVDYDIQEVMWEAGYQPHISPKGLENLERSISRMDYILKSLCGRSEEAVLKEIRKRGKSSAQRKETKREASARWKEADPELKEHIVGIKTTMFRTFEDGFSVTVLLKKTGKGHKQYLASHQKELLTYVSSEIQSSRRIIEKIGDLRYYKPHKLLFRATGKVEILFVLKDGIEKAFTD